MYGIDLFTQNDEQVNEVMIWTWVKLPIITTTDLGRAHTVNSVVFAIRRGQYWCCLRI
jgi:hypothetical protein